VIARDLVVILGEGILILLERICLRHLAFHVPVLPRFRPAYNGGGS
jgi:hypothetical protein